MNVKNSSRLTFALMNRDEAKLLFQLDQDPEVMHYINDGKANTMEDILNIYIPRLEKYTNKEQGWGQWKVSLKQDSTFIGWVLVRPMNFFSGIPELNNLELGYRFLRRYWGNGYATEAVVSIKEALLHNNNIDQLTAIALEGNKASINIMTKLGMNYLKTVIHKDPLGDQKVVLYQLKVK